MVIQGPFYIFNICFKFFLKWHIFQNGPLLSLVSPNTQKVFMKGFSVKHFYFIPTENMYRVRHFSSDTDFFYSCLTLLPSAVLLLLCKALKAARMTETRRRKKADEMWCGELHQLRKFLFFCDQQELQGKERLYILVRMESGVETSEYC